MADLRGLKPNLRRVISRMITNVDRLSDQIGNGEITADQWRDEMQAQIGRFMQTAMMTGKGSQELTDGERNVIRRLTGLQFAFLDNFHGEITAEGWREGFRSRAQMYASAITSSYWQGDVTRQAGRALPLPAMPAEGTICLSNCGCRWRIEAVDAEAGDFDAFWELHKTENCQTCLQRAADWSPIQIRAGILL